MVINGQTLAQLCGLTVTAATSHENYEDGDGDSSTALAFLEVSHSKVSKALKKHHASMWTQQQNDYVGDALKQSAADDVAVFVDLIDKAITQHLKSKQKDPENSSDADKKDAMKQVVGDVLTEVAEKECDILGGKKQVKERFERLSVWFGPQFLKESAERCTIRPGQCNLVSYCKHLDLQKHCTPPEDDTVPSTCTGVCDSKKTHEDCEGSDLCTWISTDSGGRCL